MPDNLRAIRLRVGKNVRRLRDARGLTQEALAELVGNTGKHVGQVERGEVNVTIDILAGLAAALATDVSALFTDPDRRRRAEPTRFALSARDLDQIEHVIRKARGVPVVGSDSD
jgi:transcriptional regulator with XRE-family HTH domain